MITITRRNPGRTVSRWISASALVLLVQTAVVQGQTQRTRSSAQAPPRGGRFAVQIGATSDRPEAEAKLKRAHTQKLDAYVVKSSQPGIGTLYRIRFGNYASRAAAEEVAQQFKASGLIGEYVVVAYEKPEASTAISPASTGKAAATPATKRDVALTASSFSATGLFNEQVLTNLYRGEFEAIDFDREDLKFGALYGSYLNSYARRCEANLPKNRVEMTRQRCVTWNVTRNGYGVEISRYCVDWVDEGTDLYADPEMYDAKLKLDRLKSGDVLRMAFGMLAQKDPIAGSMGMVATAQAAMSDMEDLVKMNGCTSPGLMRFQENMRLFALNKQPIRLMARAPTSSVVTPQPGVPFKDQNYTRLIEDLVSEQSKSWVMNRYVSGSVSGVSVTLRDAQGRPSKVEAQYIFNGFNNRSRGSVTVTFTDGLPECMYFFDFPATCRTPNRRIVAAYAEGAYKVQ